MPTNPFSSLDWAKVDLTRCPAVPVPPPGPQSCHYHQRCTKYFKGLSGQVKLFPVAFESGSGCVLVDVDGNRYIDFSSGIYVTTLGHCHPKVSQAVAKYANQLMNAHDFTTPIKTRLVEKLAEVLPGDYRGFQFYDAGTAAVEAGMRVLRAATGRHEMLSCFNDFHGKTYGAVSLAQVRSHVYGPGACPAPHASPARQLSSLVDQGRRHDRHRSVHRLLRRVHPEGHHRQRGGLRAGADPGLGRLGDAARRFLSQVAEVLRREAAAVDGRRSADELGPHGKMALFGALGRAARRGGHRQGFRQRLSGHGRGGARAVQGEFREDFRLQQLWRQPHGLRRGPGFHGSHPGREPAGTCPAPGRGGPGAAGSGCRASTPSSATCGSRDA